MNLSPQDRDRLTNLIQYLPARDVGWTLEKAQHFLDVTKRRASQASKRLIKHRVPGPSPTSAEGLMILIEHMLDTPKLSKTYVTEPEKRAVRLWHKLVRAEAKGRA